jgi:acyl dehydratase
MRYFDDITVGDRIELGMHVFTAEEIKTFAAQYDPQAFHMDEAAAAKSHFGALCASGWHTIAVWMRLRVLYGRREDAERAARGEIVAKLGPSPGFRDLKWLKPVYAGDMISYASEVAEKRASQSRPGWGLVFARNTGTNQKGELVLSFIGSGFVERRPGADAT